MCFLLCTNWTFIHYLEEIQSLCSSWQLRHFLKVRLAFGGCMHPHCDVTFSYLFRKNFGPKQVVLRRKTRPKLYYDGQSVGQSVLVSDTHLGPATNFFHSRFFWQFRVYCWGAPSLTRSRVSTFQFLPGNASVDFLRYESHGTHEHSLLSLFLRLPHPGGSGSCIYFPQEQGSPIIPSGIGFWEKLIAYFLLIRHRLSRKWRLWNALVKNAVEMVPGAMIFKPSSVRIGWDIHKLIQRDS
jgi:hypothetical protein